MSIWISSGAFLTRNISELLEVARVAGINNIELSSGMAHSEDLVDVVVEEHRNGGTFLVHNYFPPPKAPFVLNIASLKDEELERSLEHCKRAIILASHVDAPFYSVHAGFAANLRHQDLGKPEQQANSLNESDIDREKAFSVMLESVSQLADFCKKFNMDLLIENNVISPLYLEKMPINPLLLTTPNEVNEFFDELESENVGLLLDVAHAKVSATALEFNPFDFFEKSGNHIKAFHLSDNNGREDQNLPVNKDSWFMPLLKGYSDLEIVLEAYRLSIQDIQNQLELVSKYL